MAVYTHLSAEELARHLSGFNIGSLVSFNGITGGISNSNYLITTSIGNFVLTLLENPAYEGNLNFYLGFINCLRSKGIPCPEVIADNKGEQAVRLKDKLSIISSFMPGQHLTVIKPCHVSALGGILAQMHLAVADFNERAENIFSLAECKKIIKVCGHDVEKIKMGFYEVLKSEFEFLENNIPQNLPAGTIHGDLFADNVFFNQEGSITGIIDFYLSCHDMFVYDLMIAVNAWCFNKQGEVNKEKLKVLLTAYEAHRPLSADEKYALPLFGRLAALRIISTRTHDWLHPAKDALVKPHNPLDYLNILNFYQAGKFAL